MTAEKDHTQFKGSSGFSAIVLVNDEFSLITPITDNHNRFCDLPEIRLPKSFLFLLLKITSFCKSSSAF